MNSDELLETALHVLVAWTEGRKPAPAEVETLRTAFPRSANLRVDEIACQIIHDLGGRTIENSRQSGVEKSNAAKAG